MSGEHDKEMQQYLDDVHTTLDAMGKLLDGKGVDVVMTAAEAVYASTLAQFIKTSCETNAERKEMLTKIVSRLATNVADDVLEPESPIATPESKIILKA